MKKVVRGGCEVWVAASTEVAETARFTRGDYRIEGERCVFGEHTYIATNRIDDGVRVGRRSEIKQGVIIEKNVVIGEDCQILEGAFIEEGVFIRDGCTIGRGAKIKAYVSIPRGWEIPDGLIVNRGKSDYPEVMPPPAQSWRNIR